MPSYIELQVDTDPQDILNEAYAFLMSVFPGWTPRTPNLDVWLLMAIATVAAETRDVASAVPKSIFRWFGANLAQIPPNDDVAAVTSTTWTMIDAAGHTIPDGTQVSIQSGDVSIPFLTQGAVVVPSGSTVAGPITIVAITPGAAGSGLGSAGALVKLEDPLDFVLSVTQVAVTTGGQDAETDDDYLNRLATELQLLAPRPILPRDFEVFARNVPGVWRASAIDGYDPVSVTFNNERMVAIASIDVLGNPVDASTKAAVIADLNGRREVNFVVNAVDALVNLIDVSYQVKMQSGYDSPTVIANVNAALGVYMNPANWGLGIGPNSREWINTPILRYLELAQVINETAGVDYITTTAGNYDLTVGPHLGALARADLLLTGVAPLAKLSTVVSGVAI